MIHCYFSPVGSKTTECTTWEKVSKENIRSPVAISHILTVLSNYLKKRKQQNYNPKQMSSVDFQKTTYTYPDTIRLSSGENMTWVTSKECPSKDVIPAPADAMFHSFIEQSVPPEHSFVPQFKNPEWTTTNLTVY
jgi:hypothetical protein